MVVRVVADDLVDDSSGQVLAIGLVAKGVDLEPNKEATDVVSHGLLARANPLDNTDGTSDLEDKSGELRQEYTLRDSGGASLVVDPALDLALEDVELAINPGTDINLDVVRDGRDGGLVKRFTRERDSTTKHRASLVGGWVGFVGFVGWVGHREIDVDGSVTNRRRFLVTFLGVGGAKSWGEEYDALLGWRLLDTRVSVQTGKVMIQMIIDLVLNGLLEGRCLGQAEEDVGHDGGKGFLEGLVLGDVGQNLLGKGGSILLHGTIGGRHVENQMGEAELEGRVAPNDHLTSIWRTQESQCVGLHGGTRFLVFVGGIHGGVKDGGLVGFFGTICRCIRIVRGEMLSCPWTPSITSQMNSPLRSTKR